MKLIRCSFSKRRCYLSNYYTKKIKILINNNSKYFFFSVIDYNSLIFHLIFYNIIKIKNKKI